MPAKAKKGTRKVAKPRDGADAGSPPVRADAERRLVLSPAVAERSSARVALQLDKLNEQQTASLKDTLKQMEGERDALRNANSVLQSQLETAQLDNAELRTLLDANVHPDSESEEEVVASTTNANRQKGPSERGRGL